MNSLHRAGLNQRTSELEDSDSSTAPAQGNQYFYFGTP